MDKLILKSKPQQKLSQIPEIKPAEGRAYTPEKKKQKSG